ncbi:MAG: DUF58 domain-containing protein [Myxococcales bacterium]|nr:DUF58 domain-containing protein [Myxococcales bacterium]
MTSDPTDSSSLRERFLDPTVVMRMGGLLVRARSVVEGAIAGMHRSPHKGSSVEFAEYKEYAPGDEIKHIDWKAFGKSDRYYVKQFEDETNLRAYMVLDGSGSMNFASEGCPTKLEYAQTLAASFAFLMLRQGDAVGALAFDDQPGLMLPPSSKSTHLTDILHVLESLPGDGRTDIAAALQALAERLRRRGMLVIISDMLDDAERVMTIARVMRKRRQEVAIFHIIDPAELDLPYEGLTIFEGLEGEEDLLVDPDDIRDRYREEMRAHLNQIETECREGDIEYFRTVTTRPLELALMDFIVGRLQVR